MKSFIEGRRMGLRTIPNNILLTMPSLYQLFPHALNDWLLTADGLPLERDQFDIEIWRRFQWSVFDPRARDRLVEGIADPAEGERYLESLEHYLKNTWNEPDASPGP